MMVQGGNEIENVTANGSFTGFNKNVAGVGFALEPVSPHARFPVHVYLNGTSSNLVVVESAAWQGEHNFASLKVDVSPSNGIAGDTWRVKVRPDATAQEVQRLRTDTSGRLEMARRGSVLAWYDANRSAWSEYADVNHEKRRYYLKPGELEGKTWEQSDELPTTDRAHLTWDMGAFKEALFSMEMTPGLGDVEGHISMVAELCATPKSQPFATVTMDNVWQGRTDTAGFPRAIRLGAGVDETTVEDVGGAGVEVTKTLHSTKMAPYVRFYFMAFTDAKLFLESGGAVMRPLVSLTFR